MLLFIHTKHNSNKLINIQYRTTRGTPARVWRQCERLLYWGWKRGATHTHTHTHTPQNQKTHKLYTHMHFNQTRYYSPNTFHSHHHAQHIQVCARTYMAWLLHQLMWNGTTLTHSRLDWYTRTFSTNEKPVRDLLNSRRRQSSTGMRMVCDTQKHASNKQQG